MILKVPLSKTVSASDCFDVAASMVLGFHGASGLRRQSSTTDGVSPCHAVSSLRNFGVRVIEGSMEISDLKHYCDNGKPVMALVHWDGDHDSHWVVVVGVSRGKVWFCDSDGRDSLPVFEFESQWLATGKLGEKYIHWGIVGYFSKGTLANT